MSEPSDIQPKRESDRGMRVLEHLLAGDDEGLEDVEEVLFDPVTHLPTLHLLLKQIQSTLAERQQVGILTLHVSPFVKVEEMFGWETFDEVIRTISELLLEIKREQMRDGDALAELSMSGNSFVFVLSPPRYNQSVAYRDLDRLRHRIYDTLQVKLAERFSSDLSARFGCFIGCVVVTHDAKVQIKRLIFRALDRAYSDAFQERARELEDRVTALNHIIDSRQITTYFQPIVDLVARRVIGYEAFSRGPQGPFESGDYLFKLAYQTSLLWKLERLCRDQAVARAADLPADAQLFINVDPDSVYDPELSRWTENNPLGERVVLEITERAGISDYVLFRRVLDLIRKLGYQFAIDDVGSAYSGLRVIAEVRPAFIKLDMNITRGVHGDHVKRELVATIARLSEAVGSPLIVEGIETREELDAVREIGVRYAQGYLFGMPQTGFPQVDFAALGLNE